MDTILKFDRVILTKELDEKFKKVGEEFEIANVLDNSFLLRDTKTRVAIGVVSFEDFDKHFVAAENFKGWTQWTPFTGYNGQTDCFYRTNRKKVQVKFVTDKVRAEACLNKKEDEFNLYFGINLAYLRCLTKAMCKRADKYQEEVYKLDKEIYNNNKIIKQMINNLGSKQ